MELQIELVIAVEAVQGIVRKITTPTSTSTSLRIPPSNGASTPTPPSASTPFILSPLAASRLETQWWREPRIKVLGPRSIKYWGRRAGYNAIQVLKAQRQGYVSPRAHNQGFVRFEDFTIAEDLIVVKNQELKLHVNRFGVLRQVLYHCFL